MAKQSTRLQPSGQAMLYNFLLNEVLASQVGESGTFCIVSPWIINFRLDNPYYISFQEIVETRQEALHLFDILHQISANGNDVKIVAGMDSRHHSALKQLSQQSDRIFVRKLPELHMKAYVGRYGAIDGSLNLTYSGINQNIELFTYYYDEHNICKLKQECEQCFERGEQF
jgi:PLD-like domain